MADGAERARAARRLAAAAAYGGGGLGLVSGALFGLLRAEAAFAKRAIGEPSRDATPDPTGRYGGDLAGPAARIAVLGDSSAAGYGVRRVEETPGAVLACGVVEQCGCPVDLATVAVVGARSVDLATQVDRVLAGPRPDVALVLIGANDVTHVVRPAVSMRYLADAVRTLGESGVAVVVGTCPDLGTITPIAWPLRQVARSWSRRMAAGQTIVTVEQGGRSVSLGSILGPEFAAAPGLLFGPDRFHPSALGYRTMVAVLLPSVLAALGRESEVPGEPGEVGARAATEAGELLPITTAALRAVDLPGTEIAALTADGRRGRWRGGRVRLVRRRRRRHPAPAAPQISPQTTPTRPDAPDGSA